MSVTLATVRLISGEGGCRLIKTCYPALPVLLAGTAQTPDLLAAAQAAGADGYLLKGSPPDEILAALRQVAAGGSWWPQAMTVAPEAGSVGQMGDRPPPALAQRPWAQLRRNLRRSGLHQIDAKLAELLPQLLYANLSPLDRAIVEGQYRELRAARWVVSRLLATPSLPPIADSNSEEERPLEASTPAVPPRPRILSQTPRQRGGPPPSTPSDMVRSPAEDPGGALVNAGIQSTLFDGLSAKLQTPLRNQTNIPLEIDILREEKKRELLYLVMRKLIDLLDDLRYSQLQPRQLIERRSQLLLDLWQAVLNDFFGKYYVVQLDAIEVEVVNVLSRDGDIVLLAILDHIPFVGELLAHLLFQDPLVVDGVPYAVGTPEATARAEVLLDHLVIQVANAVIQPLLNHLSDVETIKQNFYDRRLISSRDIAKFRNDLSWRYRADRYLTQPRDIFESQYRLFLFQGFGIKQTTLYSPRRQELDQLSGIPLAVTVLLEFRDAVAPRVRAVFSFVGSGAIYVLTDVVGRGIGLIVRGILKGIGSAWQDVTMPRNGDRKRF